MYPIETAENWKIPNLIWWINVKLAEMESLSIVKQNNPWNAHSIFEFSYFCCPECDSKLPVKQDFIDHASINHPWVSTIFILNLISLNVRFWSFIKCTYLIKFQALVLLQRISDGSLDDVEFPFDLQEIKKEPDDQELQTQNILPGADINDIDILDEKEDFCNIKAEENNAEIKESIKKVDNDTNQLDISNEKEVFNSKLNNEYNAKPKKKKIVKRESDESCDTKKNRQT